MHIADFQRVLAAEMVSNFGSMLSRLVVPWLATLALSATPFEMGLLLMADVVAGACGALLLGGGLPFDLTIHLLLSPAALARRTDPEQRWRLPAFDLRAGVARVLDDPFGELEDDIRWWLITVWRP